MGGVLLGTITPGAPALVQVLAYEVVPCEYSQGPSYVLSENDLRTFREVVSRWRRPASSDQYVVGYFRSHTRDGLYLDEADAKLFHENINDPLAVALAVKPYVTKASEAAFFVQSEGKLGIGADAPQFLFVPAENAFDDLAELVPTEPPPPPPDPLPKPSEPPPPRPEPPPPKPAAVAPEALPESRAPRVEVTSAPIFSTYYPVEQPAWRRRMLWCAFTLAVLGFGAVGGYEYAGGRTWPLTLAAAKPATDPYNINLSATAQERSILLRWDRTSEAVRAAVRGTLTITEPSGNKEVSLDGTEVRNGTVLYQKVAPDASFRLQLYFNDNRVFAETVTLGVPK